MSKGLFNSWGKLSHKILVGHDGGLFNSLGGTEIWAAFTGNFINGKKDGYFLVQNDNLSNLVYKTEVVYKNGAQVSFKQVLDQYYDERLANEAKRYQETIYRMNNAKSTGKFFIMDKRDAYYEKYTCNGNEYKY